MKKSLLLFCLFLIIFNTVNAENESYQLLSPDENIEVEIVVSENITYLVSFKGKEIIHPSPINMELNNSEFLGLDPKVKSTVFSKIDETIIPIVAEKRAKVENKCNELTIEFKGNYSLKFRAYNDGVAYRWMRNRKHDYTIVNELSSFHLSENDSLYFPEEESFLTHSERLYTLIAVKDITDGQMSCMPVLVKRPDGIRIAITESDLLDYPGMYLRRNKDNESTLQSLFPPYALKEKQENDRTISVEEAADFIAITSGTRSFPWRVMIITDDDAKLIESNMVFKLGSPNQLKDTDWIKPGKVAWEWWNALNITGVDFESGLNTDTYKYYIDFASTYDIPYIILDEGWSDTEDLLSIHPDIDLPELFEYAQSKNVGIILWVVWCTLENQLDEAMEKFEAWGAKGIKVDFMQRDDQKMVNYYETIAREAANHKLLVNFHGSYKPTGLRRTYPNVLTREGVYGLENNKWSGSVTPEHNVTLPFTRMLAGPMDYTPGAMINSTPGQFQAVWDRPMSLGTRCHQLAMYVVYESPLQMLADSPSNYYKEPETMDFLRQVPVTWDDTKVLDAKVGDYLLVARKKDGKWYMGAMTDGTPRELELDMNALGNDFKTITIWQDGANADKNPMDIKVSSSDIDMKKPVKVKLAPGGGWVAIVE